MVLDAEILPVFGHNGSDGTMSFVDPLRDVIVCYFTQSRDTSTLTPMMVLAGEAIK
jgi:CubicO group peptidase (beta-lactamase class C family)